MVAAVVTWRAGFGAPPDTARALSAGQRLVLKYFPATMVLFLAQAVVGLLAGLQFIYPEFLFGVLDFNVNRMVHLNAHDRQCSHPLPERRCSQGTQRHFEFIRRS